MWRPFFYSLGDKASYMAPPPPPRLFGAHLSSGSESAPASPAVTRLYSGGGATPTAAVDGADCACAGSFFARRAAHRAGGGAGPLSFHEDGCPLKPGF